MALQKAKKAQDPRYAPWREKAVRAYNEAVDRLDALNKKVQWNEETANQLQAILDYNWGWIDASLGLCGKPEPQSQIRWFRIFPNWFALIPADLQLPALLEMQKERPNRRNWLDDWLQDLSWQRMTIPKGLTQDSMGTIIRTVIENVDTLDDTPKYCKKCALLYPIREHEFLTGILPSCPNCGGAEPVYSHAVT